MKCRRKLSFRTVEQAETTARIIYGIRGGATPPKRLYQCAQCGLLHWTSMGEQEVGARASTVAVVEPSPEPSPLQPVPPPPTETRAQRHIREVEARLRAASGDLGWLKREVHQSIVLLLNGYVADAIARLDALVSMPKGMSHTTNPAEVEAFLAKKVAEQLAQYDANEGTEGAA